MPPAESPNRDNNRQTVPEPIFAWRSSVAKTPMPPLCKATEDGCMMSSKDTATEQLFRLNSQSDVAENVQHLGKSDI